VPAPVPAAPVPVPAPTSQLLSFDAAAAEARLFELINSERITRGLPPATINVDLHAMARAHSDRMLAAGNIFHSDELFTAEAKRRLGAGMAGENVAFNTSIDSAHSRLMASPHHFDNIVNPRFTVMAMGVASTVDRRLYITEMFFEPSGRAPVPAVVAVPKPAAVPKPTAAPRPAPSPKPSVTPIAPAPPVAITDGTPAIETAPPPVPQDATVAPHAQSVGRLVGATGEQASGLYPITSNGPNAPQRGVDLLAASSVAVLALGFALRRLFVGLASA
jgi:hypothetical protein